jgi:hypothetical protein
VSRRVDIESDHIAQLVDELGVLMSSLLLLAPQQTSDISIVDTHGGRLWATGVHPHGALFQFAIPVR